MRVAKNLMAGRVLETRLFKLPDSLRETAGLSERYTSEVVKACEFLLREHARISPIGSTT